MKKSGWPDRLTPEKRIFTAEIRSEGEAAAGAEVIVEGTAAVFNSTSENLGGFTERIEPGFFRGVLAGDTRALLNHDPNFVLGRTTASTLTLSEADTGLVVSNRVDNSPRNQDYVLRPMARGELSQMSFSFFTSRNGDKWEEQADGSMLRTLLPGGCERLLDVSYVTFPAYPATDAAQRSLDRWRAGDLEATQARANRLAALAQAAILKG